MRAVCECRASRADVRPVVERTVYDSRESLADSVIDLDSGKLFTARKDLLEKPGEELPMAMGEKHARSMGNIERPRCDGRVWLAGKCRPGRRSHWRQRRSSGRIATFAVQVENDAWNKSRGRSLVPPLPVDARGPREALVVWRHDYRRQVSATFVFRTREAGIGILQIVGITKKPKA